MKANFLTRAAAALGFLTFSAGIAGAAPWVIFPPHIVVESRVGYAEPVDDRYEPAPPPPPRRTYYRDDCVEVRAQQKLRRLGYYHGSIDGIFGYGSQRALMNFQEDRGLRVTGRLDRWTLDALRID
ncbi:MAG: peptidoglycan-binding domain-containing protein [Luteolibacter sp.]